MKKQILKYNQFEEYFEDIKINNKQKSFTNYTGIIKKEYPKWEGWKLIAKYKENSVTPANIKSNKLDTLVKNFYYLKFIKTL